MAEKLPTIYVTGETPLSADMLAAALITRYHVVKTLPVDLEENNSIVVGAGFASRLSSALAVVKRTRQLLPKARFVVVGGRFSEEDCLGLIEAGASAFVPDDGSLGVLLSTVDAVWRGQSFCSQRMASLAFARLAALARSQPSDEATLLTFREGEIFRLVREGLSNKEIANRLSISVSTVKNHVHHILEKLRIRRRRDAINWDSRLMLSARHVNTPVAAGS